MPFRPRLGAQRITGLQRDQACYLLAARLQCVADLHQHSAAHARVGAAPGRVCLGGGLDGAIDVLRATARHQTDGAAVRGVLHRDGMANALSTLFPSINMRAWRSSFFGAEICSMTVMTILQLR